MANEMKRMDPKVKARWVAALRSGEYRQGFGALKKDGAFCCLGLLCELHSQETGNEWRASDERLEGYMDAVSLPPRVVREWAGLPSDFGATVVIAGEKAALTEHNDGIKTNAKRSDTCRTFAEIADAIEAQL